MLRRLGVLREIEWSWSLTLLVVSAVASFSLPAWAVRAADLFADYAPLSWVVAGFAGLLAWALAAALFSFARAVGIRARFNKELIRKGGSYIDPLALTFEAKRIYINDFILPSAPYAENKTFISCDIVGPAVIFLDAANVIRDLVNPRVDFVLVPDDANPMNCYVFRNCTFRNCRFIRITFMVRKSEFTAFNNPQYTNWVTEVPGQQPQLPGLTAPSPAETLPLPPPDTGEDKPP